MKTILLYLLTIVVLPSCAQQMPPNLDKLEWVMHEHDSVSATTDTGLIQIKAGKGLERSYTWEGASRSAILIPREERWYGSLGAYYPGPENHWQAHNGVTRGVLQEGQQHFTSLEEAQKWLKTQSNMISTVYSKSGLVVSFGKKLEREQVNIELWQIFINKNKPDKINGAKDGVIKYEPAKK